MYKASGYSFPAKSKPAAIGGKKPKGSKKSISMTRALMAPMMNKFMKGSK